MQKINLITKIKSTDSKELNNAVKQQLKKTINLQHLKSYKFSAGNERLSEADDALYSRSASILVKLVHNPMSIAKLAKAYNKKKRRGVKPNKVYPASRFLIRKIVFELQSAGYLHNSKKGRYSSKKSKDLISTNIIK